MTKEILTCSVCGGTYAANDSAQKRHYATLRHATGGRMVVPVTEPTPAPTLAEEYAALPSRHDVSDEQIALSKTMRERREWITERQNLLKKYRADLKWRETRAPHLVGKYEALIDETIEDIEIESDLLAQEAERYEQFDAAASKVRGDFWTKVGVAVQAEFQTNDVYIRPEGDGSLEVSLTTGKILERHTETCASRSASGDVAEFCNCEMIVWPETRFGYRASVRQSHDWKATVVHGPFVPSWGSMQMDSVAEAEDMLRVHALSLDIAKWLNESLGLA